MMEMIDINEVLAQSPVVENLKNFAGVDPNNKMGLMTPEKLASVVGEKIDMRTDIIAKKYGKGFTLTYNLEIEVGELRGIYSVYINSTGGKAKFEFNGSNIINALSDQFDWIKYSTSGDCNLSIYVKAGKVTFRSNRREPLEVLCTII